MIENESDHNRFIYHYTCLDTVENYILPDGTIRLSQYTKTNDPKETREWQFSLGTNTNADLGKYSSNELSQWLSNELKEQTKLVCFCKDKPGLKGNNFADLFKRGYSKPRMWAQYANKHQGVCLVIDKMEFISEVKRQVDPQNQIVYGDVKYIDESPIPGSKKQHFIINVDMLESVGRRQYMLSHLSTHYQKLFFQKMLDWKDELEWRCIVFSSDTEDLYINLNNSLRCIVYGDGLENEDISRLMNLSEKYNVSHLGLKWRNAAPWYDYSNPIFLNKR